MKSALIISRADSEFGYGHLSRVAVLAKFLRSQRNFEVKTILLGDERSLTFARTLGEPVTFFPSWELKWSIRRTLLRNLLEKTYPDDRPQIVIFDLYDFFDTFWGRGLIRKVFPFSSCIGLDIYRSFATDVTKERKNYKPVQLDCVVNSLLSPFGSFEKYKSGVKVYFGTKFMILPPVIAEIKKWRLMKGNDKVTIFLGGGGTRFLRELLLECASLAPLNLRFEVYASFPELIQDLRSDTLNVKPLTMDRSFLTELATSRFVIASAGSVLYQLAYLGVPVIVVPVVAHQLGTARKFSDMGYGRVVLPGARDFRAKLNKALLDFMEKELLTRQSEVGKKLVDDKGIIRVTEIIEETIAQKSRLEKGRGDSLFLRRSDLPPPAF